MAKLAPDGRADPDHAVLVCIIEQDGVDRVILTKRPEALAQYSGHVSLPGGRRDSRDVDLAATALRETEEEVGIPFGRIVLTFEMDRVETSLGHAVKPFVGRVLGPCVVLASPSEVERVLYLDADALTPALFQVDERRSVGKESGWKGWTFDLDGFEVWGLTARILRNYALGRVGPLGSRSG
jgi:8-oxo-dGTP pyrophosphatase MutT (NUDIX family)